MERVVGDSRCSATVASYVESKSLLNLFVALESAKKPHATVQLRGRIGERAERLLALLCGSSVASIGSNVSQLWRAAPAEPIKARAILRRGETGRRVEVDAVNEALREYVALSRASRRGTAPVVHRRQASRECTGRVMNLVTDAHLSVAAEHTRSEEARFLAMDGWELPPAAAAGIDPSLLKTAKLVPMAVSRRQLLRVNAATSTAGFLAISATAAEATKRVDAASRIVFFRVFRNFRYAYVGRAVITTGRASLAELFACVCALSADDEREDLVLRCRSSKPAMSSPPLAEGELSIVNGETLYVMRQRDSTLFPNDSSFAGNPVEARVGLELQNISEVIGASATADAISVTTLSHDRSLSFNFAQQVAEDAARGMLKEKYPVYWSCDWKADAPITARFWRSNVPVPKKSIHYICLALETANSYSVRVLRPSNGVSQMQKIDLRQRYSPITSKASASRQWDVWLSGEDICAHGPDCRRGAGCIVGKRVQPLDLLTGDADGISDLLPTLRQAIERAGIELPYRILNPSSFCLPDGLVVGVHIPRRYFPTIKACLDDIATARR